MLLDNGDNTFFLCGARDARATLIFRSTRTYASDYGRRDSVVSYPRTPCTRSHHSVEYMAVQVPDRMSTFSAFAPAVLSVPDRDTVREVFARVYRLFLSDTIL